MHLLFEAGVDIHYDYDMPLYKACVHGNYEVAKFLIENGADVNRHHNFSDQSKKSQHDCLIESLDGYQCNFDIIKLLVENGYCIENKSEIARIVIFNNQVDILKYLIDHGYDINVALKEIKFAFESNNTDIILFLIENGADIYNCFEEVISIAARLGNFVMVKYLYNISPKNVNIQNKVFIEAFNDSIQYGNYDIVKWFLDLKIDPTTCTLDSIITALYNYRLKVITLVLSYYQPDQEVQIRKIYAEIIKNINTLCEDRGYSENNFLELKNELKSIIEKFDKNN
jgi:ankyrin repeat protein